MGEDLDAGFGLVAEGDVEGFGSIVFDLYFNVRNSVLDATFVYCFEEGSSYALAPGVWAYVEVFDAGEVCPRGDVEAVGQKEDTDDPVLFPGGEYLHVSGLDGLAQSVGEIPGDGFAVPQGFFEESQGFGEAGL